MATPGGLAGLAPAGVVTAPQGPPLTAWLPPLAGETPDEEEIPVDEPCEEELDWPEPDPSVRLAGRCGSDGDRCANLAPTNAALAAAISPIRQVSFLTRRSPSSLARSAVCLVAVCWERVTR